MRYPISKRAKKFVRNRATAVMKYDCRIERIKPAVYDEVDLTMTPPDHQTIYEGPCRLWGTSEDGMAIALGDTDHVIQTVRLSIPWDVAVVPQRNDEMEILSSHTDPAVVGKRYQIQSSSKAGELRASRTFVVKAMEKVF